MKNNILYTSLLALSMASGYSSAVTVVGVQSPSVSSNDCHTAGYFTLTDIYTSAANPDQATTASDPSTWDAPSTWEDGTKVYGGASNYDNSTARMNTKCAGRVTTPNNDGPYRPQYNVGSDGDGLLNGGYASNGSAPVFTGSEFLSTGQKVVNMPGYGTDNDGEAENDPGWLFLGTSGEDGGYADSVMFDQFSQDIDFSDLVKFSIGGDSDNDGLTEWSLMLNPDIVEIGQYLLGANSFDHLAFSVKQARDGFAVFDFDFDMLFGANLSKTTAYNFYGEFYLDPDFWTGDNNDYSHIDIWARDPVAAIPLPGAIWLFGSVLLGFLGVKRFKKSA